MKNDINITRFCQPLVMAVTGAFMLAGAPTAWAAPVDTQIHACVRTSNGNVRIVSATAVCKYKKEYAASWNITGPAGPQGPAGPAGPQGAAGPQGQAAELDIAPVVEYVLPNPPSVPSDQKITCVVSANSGAASSTCPVVRWNGVTYWAFSYIDNRFSMNIVGFRDSDGSIVSQTEKQGARYVYDATVNTDTKVVTFLGQSDKQVTMTYTVPWLLAP